MTKRIITACALLALLACDSTDPRVPTALVLSHTSLVLNFGQTQTVTATVNDQHGAALDGQEIEWSSDNENVATVDGGVISTVGAGSATITATSGSLGADLSVSVVNAPTSVAVSQDIVLLDGGQTAVVTATVRNESGEPMNPPPPGYEITWSSSDEAVATAADGTITAVGDGQSNVRAHAGDLTSSTVRVLVGNLAYAMTFDFSGDRDGRFSVAGILADDSPNWTFTFFDVDDGFQDVMAQRRRPDGILELMWFWVVGQVTSQGVRPVEAAVYYINYQGTNIADAEFIYLGQGGSIDFNTVAPTYMAGTFAFPGMQNVHTGAGFSIQSGMFRAPRVDVAGATANETDFLAALAPFGPELVDRLRARRAQSTPRPR